MAGFFTYGLLVMCHAYTTHALSVSVRAQDGDDDPNSSSNSSSSSGFLGIVLVVGGLALLAAWLWLIWFRRRRRRRRRALGLHSPAPKRNLLVRIKGMFTPHHPRPETSRRVRTFDSWIPRPPTRPPSPPPVYAPLRPYTSHASPPSQFSQSVTNPPTSGGALSSPAPAHTHVVADLGMTRQMTFTAPPPYSRV